MEKAHVSSRVLAFTRIQELELESWKAQEIGDFVNAAALMQRAFNCADEVGFNEKAQYLSVQYLRLQRDATKSRADKGENEAPPAYNSEKIASKSHMTQEQQIALNRILDLERDGNEKTQSGCFDQALSLFLKSLQVAQQHALTLEAKRVALSCIHTYEAMSESQKEKRPPTKGALSRQGPEITEIPILKARDLAQSMNLVGETQRLTKNRIHLWEEEGEFHDKVGNFRQADQCFEKAVALIKSEGEGIGLERLIMCRISIIKRWAEAQLQPPNNAQLHRQRKERQSINNQSSILTQEICGYLEQALSLSEEINSAEDFQEVACLNIKLWEHCSQLQHLPSSGSFDAITCIEKACATAERAQLLEERQRLTLVLIKLLESKSSSEKSRDQRGAAVDTLKKAASIAAQAGLDKDNRRLLLSAIQILEQAPLNHSVNSLHVACAFAEAEGFPDEARRISLHMINCLQGWARQFPGQQGSYFLQEAQKITERLGQMGGKGE